MTNEEKQELARQLKNSIEDLTSYLKIIPSPADSDDIVWRIKVESLALTALTAQTVKMEPIIQIGYTHDEITCMCNIRNDDIRAIRAAGYEVQE